MASNLNYGRNKLTLRFIRLFFYLAMFLFAGHAFAVPLQIDSEYHDSPVHNSMTVSIAGSVGGRTTHCPPTPPLANCQMPGPIIHSSYRIVSPAQVTGAVTGTLPVSDNFDSFLDGTCANGNYYTSDFSGSAVFDTSGLPSGLGYVATVTVQNNNGNSASINIIFDVAHPGDPTPPEPPPSQTCGNGVVEGTEICDSGNFSGASCDSYGYSAGSLNCVGGCTDIDTSGCGRNKCNGSGNGCSFVAGDSGFNQCAPASDPVCAPPVTCGNGVIDSGEQCDGGNLGGESCPSLGYSGGSLACLGNCMFDTSACTSPGAVCGNGVVEAGEECDAGAGNGACPAACNNGSTGAACTNNACALWTCNVSAVPNSGYPPPLNNVDSQISFSWVQASNVWVDCTNDGTYDDIGNGPGMWVTNTSPSATITLADVCNYSSSGFYTMKVKSELLGAPGGIAYCTDIVSINPPSLPPSLVVEAPLAGATVSGIINVSGWALDNTTQIESGIYYMERYIYPVGSPVSGGSVITHGTINRGADVCSSYPGRVGCPMVGWTSTWDTTLVPNGDYNIIVGVYDSDPDGPLIGAGPAHGRLTSTIFTVTVNNLPPPQADLTCFNGFAYVNGPCTISYGSSASLRWCGSAGSACSNATNGFIIYEPQFRWPTTLTGYNVTTNMSAPGYPSINASDNNTGTQWVANLAPNVANNNAWIILDLGTAGPFYVDSLKWQAAAGSPYPAHSPTDYTIDVSYDGSTWTPIVTRNNPPGSGITNGSEPINRLARFIRMTTTSVADGTGWSLSFFEFWAEGNWSETSGISGTISTVPLIANTTFNLVTTGPGGVSRDATPVVINVPPAPTLPIGSCSADGTSATISWTPAPGYTTHYLRMDNSSPAVLPYLVYDDNYVGSSYTWVSTPGGTYDWWVHTKDTTNGAYSISIGGTFTCNAPPGVSNVTLTEPNYCQSGPGGTVSWTYLDPGAIPQNGYRVQVDNNIGFGSPEVDTCPSGSGCGGGVSTNYAISPGVLAFNTIYYARVMSWNSSGAVSSWRTMTLCNGYPSSPGGCQAGNTSWRTPIHAWPDNRPSNYNPIWAPTSPPVGVSVQFTDRTLFGAGSVGRTWAWTFAGGSPASSVLQTPPTVTYAALGSNAVTLVSSDDAGSCTSNQIINVQRAVPQWKEIVPF